MVQTECSKFIRQIRSEINSNRLADPNLEQLSLVGLYDITGGTGDVGTPYAEGEKAYFEYLQSKGGVEGLDLD